MEKVVSRMPAQCRKCGAFFDMSYDFSEDDGEQIAFGVVQRLLVLGNRALFCWRCRN